MEYPHVCYECKTPFRAGDEISALEGSADGRVILVHRECSGPRI